MRWIGISVSALLMTVASVACTRSFDAKYVPAMTPLQQADQLRAVRLGIGKFQDARRSVKADEPQSLSHVSRAGYPTVAAALDEGLIAEKLPEVEARAQAMLH